MEEFNMSDWRFKHLFVENKEPIGEQPIEEQPIDEAAKHENLVDEIGEFWVVNKPGTKSVIEDILQEYDVFSFGKDYFGTEAKSPGSVLGVYVKRNDANRAAKEAIKQRDMNLKEMEGAMNDFRESKKSISDKKSKVKELINKFK
jgi:hypothetical protein